VNALAADLFAAVADLPPLPSLPPCVCHGDPKLNNILFAGREPPAAEQAVCLIDLDTVGPMALAHELGDAWRSWCNRSPEDASQAKFDVEIFRASFEGFHDALGRTLGAHERRACLHGVEWISLELAARFAADALLESYFGWAPERYPGRASTTWRARTDNGRCTGRCVRPGANGPASSKLRSDGLGKNSPCPCTRWDWLAPRGMCGIIAIRINMEMLT